MPTEVEEDRQGVAVEVLEDEEIVDRAKVKDEVELEVLEPLEDAGPT